jgi:hypothetical protein
LVHSGPEHILWKAFCNLQGGKKSAVDFQESSEIKFLHSAVSFAFW